MTQNKTVSNESVKATLRIIEKTREGLLFRNSSLVDSLLSIHYIAETLKSKENIAWADGELNGFEFDSIPSYRKEMKGNLEIHNVSEEE